MLGFSTSYDAVNETFEAIKNKRYVIFPLKHRFLCNHWVTEFLGRLREHRCGNCHLPGHVAADCRQRR
jgi:hypothetical protein